MSTIAVARLEVIGTREFIGIVRAQPAFPGLQRPR
jgi:hypothetical protein